MSLEPKLIHVTRTSMVLRWSVDAGVDSYQVSRTKQAPDEQEVLLASIHPNQPMFSDPGLEPETLYRYRITELLTEDEVREAEEWTGSIRTQPETEFQSAGQFFAEFLSPVFARELTQSGHAKWCMEWWRHPEAARVVEALWWSYEAQRPAQAPEFPTKSRADFLVYHCYPLMDRLFADASTFRLCETAQHVEEHHLLNPLPQLVNPAG